MINCPVLQCLAFTLKSQLQMLFGVVTIDIPVDFFYVILVLDLLLVWMLIIFNLFFNDSLFLEWFREISHRLTNHDRLSLLDDLELLVSLACTHLVIRFKQLFLVQPILFVLFLVDPSQVSSSLLAGPFHHDT